MAGIVFKQSKGQIMSLVSWWIIPPILICVLVLVLLYLSYQSVKRSIAGKSQRRSEIQHKFESFVAANRIVELDQIAMDNFLNQTWDIDEYFTSETILRLRQELYEHAITLSETRGAITTRSANNAETLKLKNSYKELLDWFDSISNKIEPLFSGESKEHPSFKDVVKEPGRLIGRACRT